MADDFDEFASANDGTFAKLEDLYGCTVMFLGVEAEKRQGDTRPYLFVTGALIAVAGTPPTERVDGKPAMFAGEAMPIEAESFGLSSGFVTPAAERTIKTGIPLLGKVSKKRNKKGGLSFFIEDPTDADKQAARPHLARLRELTDPFKDDPAF